MKTKIYVCEINWEYPFYNQENLYDALLDDNVDSCSDRSFPQEPGEMRQVMFHSLISYSSLGGKCGEELNFSEKNK